MRAFTCPVCRRTAISRRLGDDDRSPFVLASAAIEKLAFVDALGREAPTEA